MIDDWTRCGQAQHRRRRGLTRSINRLIDLIAGCPARSMAWAPAALKLMTRGSGSTVRGSHALRGEQSLLNGETQPQWVFSDLEITNPPKRHHFEALARRALVQAGVQALLRAREFMKRLIVSTAETSSNTRRGDLHKKHTWRLAAGHNNGIG